MSIALDPVMGPGPTALAKDAKYWTKIAMGSDSVCGSITRTSLARPRKAWVAGAKSIAGLLVDDEGLGAATETP